MTPVRDAFIAFLCNGRRRYLVLRIALIDDIHANQLNELYATNNCMCRPWLNPGNSLKRVGQTPKAGRRPPDPRMPQINHWPITIINGGSSTRPQKENLPLSFLVAFVSRLSPNPMNLHATYPVAILPFNAAACSLLRVGEIAGSISRVDGLHTAAQSSM